MMPFDMKTTFCHSFCDLLQRFYRYHEHLHQKAVTEGEDKTVIYVISYWAVFKQCSPHLLNIFLSFAITLSIFPAILSGMVWYGRQEQAGHVQTVLPPPAQYLPLLCHHPLHLSRHLVRYGMVARNTKDPSILKRSR
jgi:hypothetical protein